ncbi:MAG: tryptophan 7-halogenase [Thermoanaerobaculia bacterium]|nr:tryptophan 7-halogenase [Thermoanaerobaculia bacterium]
MNAATQPASPGHDSDYDVVVVGGGFAGSSTALLLRRWMPEARILVAERGERFERKVGEATVEVSGYFLHRVLGLYDHLSRHHLPKHGLRYWFCPSEAEDNLRLSDLTEIGSSEMPRLASFQLDRPCLDQHLLDTAKTEGVEVLRPAKVLSVESEGSGDWPVHKVEVDTSSGSRQLRTRWIVDASGRQSFLARKKGLHRKVERHPTASLWARWRGVRDLDEAAILGGGPRAPELPIVSASRRLATNHFVGYGYWAWVIPLSNGNTSIGLVYDKSLYELPEGATRRERYEEFVRSTPGLRDLVQDAEVDGSDFMALSHLPYRTEQYMGEGWALVADAAAFLDPYYSPGLDHAAISIYATARILQGHLSGELTGEDLRQRMEIHNRDFLRSYERWLDCLYIGKYELMGDADLLGSSFLVDTAFYYLGVVTPVYKDLETMANPIFGLALPQARWAYKITRTFNRRLRTLARFRRRVGTYGKNNLGHHRYSRSFGLGVLAAIAPLAKGLRLWLGVEWERLVHRIRHGRVDESAPVSIAVAETPSMSTNNDSPKAAMAPGG